MEENNNNLGTPVVPINNDVNTEVSNTTVSSPIPEFTPATNLVPEVKGLNVERKEEVVEAQPQESAPEVTAPVEPVVETSTPVEPAPVVETPAAPVAPEVTSQPVVQPPVPPVNNFSLTGEPLPTGNEPKKNNKGLIIGIVAVAVVLVVLALVLGNKEDGNKEDKTTTTITTTQKVDIDNEDNELEEDEDNNVDDKPVLKKPSINNGVYSLDISKVKNDTVYPVKLNNDFTVEIKTLDFENDQLYDVIVNGVTLYNDFNINEPQIIDFIVIDNYLFYSGYDNTNITTNPGVAFDKNSKKIIDFEKLINDEYYNCVGGVSFENSEVVIEYSLENDLGWEETYYCGLTREECENASVEFNIDDQTTWSHYGVTSETPYSYKYYFEVKDGVLNQTPRKKVINTIGQIINN